MDPGTSISLPPSPPNEEESPEVRLPGDGGFDELMGTQMDEVDFPSAEKASLDVEQKENQQLGKSLEVPVQQEPLHLDYIRFAIEGHDENVTYRRRKFVPMEIQRPVKTRRIQFAPEVKVRFVTLLDRPFAGWVIPKKKGGKIVAIDKVGFGLSDEHFDSSVNLEDQVALQKARRLAGSRLQWTKRYIEEQTDGPPITVLWEKASVSLFYYFLTFIG